MQDGERLVQDGESDAHNWLGDSAQIQQLVDKVQNTDLNPEDRQAAFGEIVGLAYDKIVVLAAGIVGKDGVPEDVAQESLIRAMKGIDGFEGRSQLSTWLHKIVQNTAKTHRHKHVIRSRREVPDAFDESSDDYASRGSHLKVIKTTSSDNDPIELAEAAELRRRVEAAILELPDKLRSVIILKEIHNLSHEEIAARMGISEANSKVRLNRARIKLRELVFPLRPQSSREIDKIIN